MQENEVMSAMLKSLDPEVQAARDERVSAERIMRMQLFDYKERLARAEENLQAANALIDRLRRKISRLETEKMMAEFEARLASGGLGKKRKLQAAALDSEEDEDGDDEKDAMDGQ
jgi:multidrug resistance efflux pump